MQLGPASMSHETVRRWLADVCSQVQPAPYTPTKKRPLSPVMSNASTPSRKRQRQRGDDAIDDSPDAALEDATPRQVRPQSVLTASDTSSASASAQSGRSSPRKQLHNLRLADDGVYTRNLNLDEAEALLPPSLASLLYHISDTVTERRGLLPPSMRQEATQLFAGTLKGNAWNKEALYDVTRETLGPTGSLGFAQDIVRRARECENESYDEAGWCQKVYIRILEAVTQDSLFMVVPCSTASILPRYRLPTMPSRMIDYVIAIDPPPAEHAKIFNLIKRLYGYSINHTEFPALCERPVAISFEVKRTSDAADKAKLQLAVWLAAQWKKLQDISRQLPEFLLAVWIQGHDWSLVVSTRTEQRIVSCSNFLPLY